MRETPHRQEFFITMAGARQSRQNSISTGI
jgi:hypothetical protein